METFFSPQVQSVHGKMQNMAEAVTTVLVEIKKINLPKKKKGTVKMIGFSCILKASCKHKPELNVS